MVDRNEEKKSKLVQIQQISETKIVHLLELLGNKLTERDCQNIRRFVDAREYGLAYEQIVLALVEEQLVISSQELAILEEVYSYFLGGLIEVNPEKMQQLRTLCKDA